MNDLYQKYIYEVEEHFQKYLDFSYFMHRRHEKHRYMLSSDYPFEESLLAENREIFVNEIAKNFTPHSPGNFKSSQMLTLDLFIPFMHNLKPLNTIFGIKEKIISIKFEEIFTDFTHVDVFMETENREKIICEVKFTEHAFDQLESINLIRSHKYKSIYQDINKFMMKDPVTEVEFMNNYQLYRNLFNTLSDEKGRIGYFIVIYPKTHPLLEKQFNDFLHSLEFDHGFIYMDRIKRVYVERIAQSISFWSKYLIRKNKLIEFVIHNQDEISPESTTEYNNITIQQMDFKKIFENESEINIRIDMKNSSLVELWKTIESSFNPEYQVIFPDYPKQRNFDVVKKVNVYMEY